MIHAAQKVFAGHRYAGARMIDIAAEAGVAVLTVYFAFHTKPSS
jgi:AcrR family transcriptional regulator